MNLEHPDVSSALRSGYAGFQIPENRDTPENRGDFIDDRTDLLLAWLRLGYPEILDEFIEMHGPDYRAWLN